MAATVLIYQDTDATGATHTNVDSSGGTAPKFGTDDAVQSSTPVVIPSATGTNYSAFKNLYLDVTVAGATTINNRQIKLATAAASGLAFFWKANTGAYAQGSAPASSGSNGPATPAGYTLMTTSYALWDNTGVSTASTGKNGGYVQVVLGVDSTYAGGGGSYSNPSILLQYDES